jgi:hypothetical protein
VEYDLGARNVSRGQCNVNMGPWSENRGPWNVTMGRGICIGYSGM